MADTVHQLIIAHMDTAFKLIVTTGGYVTNLGTHINWWRDLDKNPFAATELPAANLKDRISEPTPHSMGRTHFALTIDIEVASSSMEQIRQIIGDIDVLVNANLTWSTHALHSHLLSDETSVEHLEDKYWMAKLQLEVWFITVMGTPTTQG